MALRPVVIDKRSPFLGEACALCKEPFAPGDELIICPEDATRHHARCWRANGNKCTAYGCTGYGEIQQPRPVPRGRARGRVETPQPDAKVQTLPASSFHCAQSCLLVAIAVAIILFAIGCFGLWAIADYIMIEVMGWDYRGALTGVVPLYNGLRLGLPILFGLAVASV